jgi:hypothetical protein
MDSKDDYLASKQNATVFALLFLFLCRSCTHMEQLRYLGLSVLLRAAPDGNKGWIWRRNHSRQRIDWRSRLITTALPIGVAMYTYGHLLIPNLLPIHGVIC